MSELNLTWDIDNFQDSIDRVTTRFEASVKALADVAARKMEEYAKNEAIWTDRTGNARQNLRGETGWISEDIIMIAVTHHMDYGVWLELAHDREYAILEQAIEDNVEELYRALRRLLN